MEQPLVSILTPFKNSTQYIDECIKSILTQSYQNWELIAIDDHSTDDGFAVISEYAKIDNRILLYKNEGTGIIDALNQAYAYSKGTLITRMDSDDIMESTKLEHMATQLLTNGKGHLALGLVKYFGEKEISAGYIEYQDWLNNLTQKGKNFEEIYKECSIPSPCWLVYRSDLDRAGAFEEKLYPEDYDLAFRLYKHGIKTIPSDEVLHLWRDYSLRTSKTSSNYDVEHFTTLKIHHYLSTDYDDSRSLCILGAGEKGKTIATFLVNNNIEFQWVTEHPAKVGVILNEQLMISWDEYLKVQSPQTIVTFKDKNQQKRIREIFRQRGMLVNIDYFMFC